MHFSWYSQIGMYLTLKSAQLKFPCILNFAHSTLGEFNLKKTTIFVNFFVIANCLSFFYNVLYEYLKKILAYQQKNLFLVCELQQGCANFNMSMVSIHLCFKATGGNICCCFPCTHLTYIWWFCWVVFWLPAAFGRRPLAKFCWGAGNKIKNLDK